MAALRDDSKKILDIAFFISILIKGFDGIFEVFGGMLLLFFKTSTINYLAFILTQHELSQDANDFVANAILQAAHNLSLDVKKFLALYLLTHGIIKIFLVSSLLANKLWGYPLIIIFLLIFILSQGYGLTRIFSQSIFALTLFDIITLTLITYEYRKLKNIKKVASP